MSISITLPHNAEFRKTQELPDQQGLFIYSRLTQGTPPFLTTRQITPLVQALPSLYFNKIILCAFYNSKAADKRIVLFAKY